MTDPKVQSDPLRVDPSRQWSRSVAADPWARPDSSPLRRFLGGAPIAVAAKLAIVSLLVGVMLVWLDIRPVDVYRYASETLARLWSLSFKSLRDFGDYMIAGAIIVLPVWLLLRLFSFRGR